MATLDRRVHIHAMRQSRYVFVMKNKITLPFMKSNLLQLPLAILMEDERIQPIT